MADDAENQITIDRAIQIAAGICANPNLKKSDAAELDAGKIAAESVKIARAIEGQVTNPNTELKIAWTLAGRKTIYPTYERALKRGGRGRYWDIREVWVWEPKSTAK